MNIFVTGTDTGVGKTIVTAGIAAVMQSLGFTIGVLKPVQAGASKRTEGYICSPDLDFITQVDANIFTKCTYLLNTPAAPVVGASIEGEVIDINLILRDYRTLKEQCDFVIVEGAGGITVPLSPTLTTKDLIKVLELPVLVVARPDLGTINHTVLTAEYADKYNIDVLGVIISGYPRGTIDPAIKTAPQVISAFIKHEFLGIIPRIPGISHENPQAEALIEAVLQNIDLEKIFRVQLPRLSDALN